MLIQSIEALLLGLSLGPFCLAYCSPVLFPFLASSDKFKISGAIIELLLFLSGRLIGYIIIGFLIGLIGIRFEQFSNGGIFGIISILLGLALIYFGIHKNFPESKLCKILHYNNSLKFYSVLFGFLTGINLCPPFFAAIIGAGNTGSILGSILYFLAFFFGTSIYFPLILLYGFLSKITLLKTIASISLIISGIWFFFRGLVILFS
jgi:sulfite exporter TauE/SafE